MHVDRRIQYLFFKIDGNKNVEFDIEILTRSFVDIVQKDVHLFKRLQSHPKEVKLRPIELYHFDLGKVRPLIQPLPCLKNCYYKSTKEGYKIDVITSVDVLYSTFDGHYGKDYIESVLRSNDFDMIVTSRKCITQRALSFVQHLDIKKQVIHFF